MIHSVIRTGRRAVVLLGAALLAACASTGGGTATQQPSTRAGTDAQANAVWPVKSREHVDLWIHGFAMLVDDTARVPWFRKGYRDQMVVLKNRANVTTLLDANRDRLRARLLTNGGLAINGQFIALYAGSWQDLKDAADVFLRAEGDPNRANSQQAAAAIALFAQAFPAATDRDWLRLFIQSLDDEAQKYYHSYWLNEERARAPVLAAVDSEWQKVHRPRLQGFLNNSRQPQGSLLLSLALGSEGRTINEGSRGNLVTVAFPTTVAAADEAIFGFVHEAAGRLAAGAVNDNVTPSEQRAGLADRLQSAAAVRTGYQVLLKVDPSLAPGYADYYLRAAKVPRSGGSAEAQLAAAFPLPTAIADAINRQLDVVLGGI